MSKVAIVGVEGSGKTVLMAALAEMYGEATHDGVYLMPENQAAFSFMTMIPHKMRVEHQWPAATAIQSMKYLKWTVRIGQEVLTELEMLDYPGELYRLAFGERKEEELKGSREQVHEFLEHLLTADDLIVLFNLKDAMDIGANARNNETVWLTRGIFDFAQKNLPNVKKRLLLFTQADRYRDVLAAEGDAMALQNKYLPMLSILHPDLDCATVSAVESGEANDQPSPASGGGMQELMKRMVLASETGKRAIQQLAKCRASTKKAMPPFENNKSVYRAVNDLKEALEEVEALESKIIESLFPGALAELKAKYEKVYMFWRDYREFVLCNRKNHADKLAWTNLLKKYQGEPAFLETIRNLIAEEEQRRNAIIQAMERDRIAREYNRMIGRRFIVVWVVFLIGLLGYLGWRQQYRSSVIDKLKKDTQLEYHICEQAYQGSSSEQYQVGLAYLNKVNEDSYFSNALKWFSKAAKEGHAGAQNIVYVLEAVNLGNADARFILGKMYAEGRGVTKDKAEAVKWYRKAAAQGDQEAQRALKALGYSW